MDTQPTASAAHIFLDLVQQGQSGDVDLEPATQQLVGVGAIKVDFDPASDTLDLDVSHTLLGGLAVLQSVIAVTATNWGLSVDDTVARLREAVDTSFG